MTVTEPTIATTTTQATAPRSAGSPMAACDANIRVKPATTTCPFAENTFYEFHEHPEQTTFDVYSPAAGDALRTHCVAAAGETTCTTADGGLVRFSEGAAERYTDANARAYAAHAHLDNEPIKTTENPQSRTGSDGPRKHPAEKVCYPAADLPAVTLPPVTIPAVNVAGQHYPAQHYPAQHYPAQHYPAQHYGGGCLNTDRAFAPSRTTVLDEHGNKALDDDFSAGLTTRYRRGAGASADSPDPTARGFGGTNQAGFPKNQYVRPYIRTDGTFVSGYWRNSPTDGLPTCQLINC